jgi:hypothetical protein
MRVFMKGEELQSMETGNGGIDIKQMDQKGNL